MPALSAVELGRIPLEIDFACAGCRRLPDFDHAEPVQISGFCRPCSAGSPMSRCFRSRISCSTMPREIVVRSARQVPQEAVALTAAMARRAPTKPWSSCSSTCRRPSAAPARIRLSPIATTSTISPRICVPRDAQSPGPTPTICADLKPRRTRLHGFVVGAAVVGGAPALSFPLCRRKTWRRSGGVLEGPKRARLCQKYSRSPRSMACCAGAPATEDDKQPPTARLRAAGLLCLLESLTRQACASRTGGVAGRRARRDQSMPVVRGKGNKERLVPLNQAAKRTMDDVSRKMRGEADPKEKVDMAVPVIRRTRPSYPPASARELKNLGAGRDFTERSSPHVLRHALRQPSAAQRRRPRVVQKLLGHADISTTQI